MRNFRQATLLAGAGLLLLAPLAFAAATDAEFKCEQSADKAGAKFVASKSKCIQKCSANAWKGLGSFSDCFPPYGGSTAQCIDDTSSLDKKGAEDKFRNAILKACDVGTNTSADCPECYSGGDCTTEAADRVQNVEGQVDDFGPGVFCEQPGADKLETGCEQNTAKTLAKLVATINKCYDKCNANMRKGTIPPGSCNAPSPSDAATTACLSDPLKGAQAKAIAGVNKKCRAVGETTKGANDGTTAVPDCTTPNDYPDGSAWVNLVTLAISGNVPGTYCSSPSGAFIQ